MQQVIIGVGANTKAFDVALQKSLSRVAQPLGKITGSVSDFDKSLSASNARVLAFGASAASIYSIKRAFDFTVTSMIDVEKALTDINVLLKLSSSQLEDFGSGLFSVANNTASSFKEAAKAAAEFSRQGLGVNEILERTEAAMGLSRLSGLDLAESISAVTAAMNTFNKEGLSSILLVDKLASVDAAFAVSSADLAQAIKRVGSVAEDSNVSLDQMLALTAATQQKTARGGAIIGNAFKTIFTRLNRPEVLDQLEQLGISTRDVTGQIHPLMEIMQELAKRYDKLAPAAKSTTSELLGGVFQINILKAAMSDLGNEFSIYNQALKTAEKATGDFSKRNEELNKTISAKMVQALNIATQLSEKIGTITLKPVVSGGIDMFKDLMQELNDTLSSKSELENGQVKKVFSGFGGELGHSLVKGLFGAIGGMITGPFLQILATIATKLSIGFVSFAVESGKSLLGLESKAQLYRKALEQTQYILSTHPELLKQISQGTMSVKDVQQGILALLEAQTKQMQIQSEVAARIAGVRSGYLTSSGTSQPGIVSRTVSRIGSIFAAGNVPDEFLIEELNARALGASNTVQAKWSKGTINGKKFVLNNQETEYPGMGANGDSIVIPHYGKAKGFAQGYAGGDIGMSLMLGLLAGSRTGGGQLNSPQLKAINSELEKLQDSLKIQNQGMADAVASTKKAKREHAAQVVLLQRRSKAIDDSANIEKRAAIDAAKTRMLRATKKRDKELAVIQGNKTSTQADIATLQQQITAGQALGLPTSSFQSQLLGKQQALRALNNQELSALNKYNKEVGMAQAHYVRKVKKIEKERKVGQKNVAFVQTSNDALLESTRKANASSYRAFSGLRASTNASIASKVKDKEAEEKLLKEQQEMQNARQGKAFKASIIASGIAGSGLIPTDKPAGQAIQSGIEGAALGSQVVSAIPTKLGLFLGFVAGAGKTIHDFAAAMDAKRFNQLNTQLDILKERNSLVSGKLNEYYNTIGTLSSSYADSNVSVKNLIEMQNKASKLLAEMPADVRNKILTASTNEEKRQILEKEQIRMTEEEDKLSQNVKIASEFTSANRANSVASLLNPIEWPRRILETAALGAKEIGIGSGEFNAAGGFKRSGVFAQKGFWGESREEKLKNDAAAKAYATTISSGMKSEDTKKALGVFSASKGMSASQQIIALAGAGVLNTAEAGEISQNEEGSARVIANLKQRILDSEAARLAQETLTEKSKEYGKQLFYINKELEIMRETSQSVYASMNADVTSYIKNLISASGNLVKLANAKRTGQIDDAQAKEEIYSMKYGASTMNSIKFAGKRAQVLTETGNKEREAMDKASGDIIGVVMSKVLSSSNSIFKNTDGSSNVSESALYAKSALASIVGNAMRSGVNDPNKLFETIKNSISSLPLNNKLGATITDDKGKPYTQQQIDSDPALQKKQKESIKMANEAMKLELQSAFASGAGNVEQKAILDTLKAQLEAEKTDAKIQIDALNRQEQQQQKLIEIQKNAKMFGGLPTSKKEQKDLERDIKRTEAKAARGDVYALNKLTKMASENFGDDLSESSVAGLKGKVKLGEANRIQRMVGLFGKNGLISGLPQQYNMSRIKQIAADKVDTTLKTEKGKGFDAEALVNSSLSKELVTSNKSLKASLDNLEQTLKATLSSRAGVIPEKSVADAAEKQRQLADKEKTSKAQVEEIKKQRESEVSKIQEAFSKSLKDGLKVGLDGKVSFQIDTGGLSEDLANAMKGQLTKLIEDQVAIQMGIRASDPSKVKRLTK